VLQDLLSEDSLFRQRPGCAQPCQCVDTIVNRQDEIIPLVCRADNGFHREHQTGVQGGFPKPTESAAWGLGVFHSLSLTGENSSNRELGGRVDLEWRKNEGPRWILTTYE
jgi:hypothetical protein